MITSMTASKSPNKAPQGSNEAKKSQAPNHQELLKGDPGFSSQDGNDQQS